MNTIVHPPYPLYPRGPWVLDCRLDGYEFNEFFPTLEAPEDLPRGGIKAVGYVDEGQSHVILSGCVCRPGVHPC